MSFDNIKGHDSPIKLLRDCMMQGRLASSHLFIGPEGIGKRLTAITFAKALNCEAGQFNSCDNCPSCLKIEKLQHADLHLVGEAEATKIEDIRRLQKDISLKPYEAKVKVFIIDNAHNLTAEAANALLKILEEPTANSAIILISSKPALLFKTIISRCQIIKFSPLPRQELEVILKKDYSLDTAYAHFLAYFCEGRLGFALQLKDSDILNQRDRLINELSFQGLEGKEEIRFSLNMLAVWFRDVYLAKAGTSSEELINSDRHKELLKFTHNYSFGQLDKIFKTISDSLLYLEQNINTRLLLSNLSYVLKG